MWGYLMYTFHVVFVFRKIVNKHISKSPNITALFTEIIIFSSLSYNTFSNDTINLLNIAYNKSQSATQIMPTSSLNVLTSSQYSSILPTTNVTSTMLITTTPTTNFITTEQTTSFSATTKGIVKETTVAKVVSLGVTDIPTNDTLSTTTTTTATKYRNSVSVTESHTDFGKSSTRVWKTEQATSPLYQGRFIIKYLHRESGPLLIPDSSLDL